VLIAAAAMIAAAAAAVHFGREARRAEAIAHQQREQAARESARAAALMQQLAAAGADRDRARSLAEEIDQSRQAVEQAAQEAARSGEALSQRIESLEDELQDAQEKAQTAGGRAESAQREATVNSQLVREYNTMLQKVLKDLDEAHRKGKQPGARALLDGASETYLKRRPEPTSGTLLSQLAWIYERLKAFDRAEEFARRAAELQEESLGKDHPGTIAALASVASASWALGHVDRAIESQRDVLDRSRRQYGPEHEKSETALTFLAQYLFEAARHEEAEAVLGELAALRLGKGAQGNTKATYYLEWRAASLQALGRLAEAESLLRQILEVNLRELGPDDRETFEVKCRLAWVLRLQGRTGEAQPLDEEVDGLARFMEDIDQPFRSATYGTYLAYLGQRERAERYLVANLEGERRWGAAGASLEAHVRPLLDLYQAWGRPEDAARYRGLLSENNAGASAP
jgi:hypothetical protein